MGKYFKNGRLYSADTFTYHGTRTLAAATESDLWSGTAATRPTPANQQLRVVSTSLEDDNAKAESQTITIAGTMDPATRDKWTCTVGGAVNTGDIARLTLNGTYYDTEVTPALNNLALLSAEITTSAMSGTWDAYKFVMGGTIDAGDIGALVIGSNTYSFTSGGGAGADAAMAAGLAAAAAADPDYTVTSFSANLKATKKVRGVGGTVSCSFTTDPGLDATVTTTHSTTGVAGQTAWNVTTNGVSAVIAEHATAGVTASTVASSYAVDPGANSTFAAVHTVTGAAADILAVSDGTTTFSRTVLTAVLADEVAALAAAIDASASYAASSLAGVITVVAPEGAAAFAFVNASTDVQNADLTVVVATLISSGGGTGIRTLRIDYLNGSGVRTSETVSMNGTTAVLTTATDCGAILGLSALSVGSNGSAVGTILVTNIGNTTSFEGISIGSNQSDAASLVVPASREAHVTMVVASAGAVATTVKLCSDANPNTGAVVSGAKFTWATALFGTTPEDLDPKVAYGPFPAGAKVWLTGTSAAGTACSASLEGYYLTVTN